MRFAVKALATLLFASALAPGVNAATTNGSSGARHGPADNCFEMAGRDAASARLSAESSA